MNKMDKKMVDQDIVDRIKKISLFLDFTDDEEKIRKVCLNTKREKFLKGQIIIKENDLGDKLYILNKGTVRILKKTLNNENYTVSLLVADSNVFFGELALIDSDKRSATVIAEGDCEVFSIHRKNFLNICENDPLMGYKVTLKIAKKISTSLRKMNKDVITLFEALVNEVKGEY